MKTGRSFSSPTSKATRNTFTQHTVTLLLLTGCAFLATGCAFSRTKVNVQFDPKISNPLGQNATAQLTVGEIRDSRPVTDPLVLSQKYNGYGQRTSGAYVAQEPVADIFKQGLQKVLDASGFTKSTQQRGLELKANIQEFDHDVIVGFWKATVKPKLTVRFELLDKQTGGSVWRDTYVGRDSLETTWGTGEFLVQTFNRAAEDVVRQLIADASFRKFFVTN